MELLIIDPTESLSAGDYFGPTAPSRFFPDSSSTTGANNNFRFLLESGVLSPIHIRRPFSNTYYLMFGDMAEQTEGKAVWGAACSFVLSGSSVCGVFDVPTGGDGFSLMEIDSGGVVSFMGSSAQTGMSSGDFGYFEVVMDLGVGTFEVYLNNSLIFDGTHSVDKIRNGIRFKNRLSLPTATFTYVDDFYHLGGTTGPFTDRLGPVRAVRAPLLSAAEENFIPTGAPNNLSAVNKTSLSEGSYNRSPASNDVSDRFKIDTSVIPEGKDIIGVSHRLYYRKSDIGPRNLDAVITGPSGANKVSQPLPEKLVEFGGHDPMILTQAPGGGALTIETLEDMEFGYEVKA